jgi:hypothetical protein
MQRARALAGHVGAGTKDLMGDRRLDILKALTERVASRRLIAHGLFATADIPVLGRLDVEAGRGRKRRKRKKQQPLSCSGDSCDGTGGKRCGGRDDCQCYLAATGGNVCASSLRSSLEETCNTNKDCPRGHVCDEGGPACGGRDLRFCKPACYR